MKYLVNSKQATKKSIEDPFLDIATVATCCAAVNEFCRPVI